MSLGTLNQNQNRQTTGDAFLMPNDREIYQHVGPLLQAAQVPWAQEFASWTWHLFVLPAEEARPWPRWVHRYIRPPLEALAAELNVSNPSSLRSWALNLILINAPRGQSSNPENYSHSSRRRSPLLKSLVRQVASPYLTPIVYALASRIETYSAAIMGAYFKANLCVRGAVIAVGLTLLVVSVSTPLSLGEQCTMLALMWTLSLLIRQLPGFGSGIIMMVFSIVASSRYVWWRLTQTTDLHHLEWFLGIVLLAAECYTWIVMVLGYFQNIQPLRRQPVALSEDRTLWPTVDVFIPRYNESLQVVKPTVLAALSLDWPADKLNVYILDDGKRVEFRDFAASCGAHYVIRADNAHAKAGNLNCALGITKGEFVAIFDCDHIPVRTFLTTTMGWFARDPKCAMIQTPHHFFSPDPFERNLGTFRRVPNEGNLFYGLIQDGNDLWNATFFCGSCAVLRRAPLEQIGGIAVETVTEDAHTALKLHRRGYTTAYLRRVLAGGLATENLSSHVNQRIRWARGMAQIFRLDNPLTGTGLSFFQRLCYCNAMLHFFSGIPRLVFLTAPIAYLYFQFHIINAAAVTLAVYAIPHLVQSSLTNSHLQGRFRHSFWNEAYEAVLSWYIAIPTTAALINPRFGKFNVTAKGSLVEHDFFDWRISAPYLVLVLLNAFGVLLAIPRLLFWNSFEADTVIMNLLWTLFNLALLGAVLCVAAETRQVRTAPRVTKSMPATLYLTDGTRIACESEDFSMHGLGLRTEVPQHVQLGGRLRVGLWVENREWSFPVEVTVVRANRIGLQLRELSIEEERDYVRCTFASPGAWSDWNRGTEADRPLASFAEGISFGVNGYVRMLESIYNGIASWWLGRPRHSPAR
jgi:cellulose synthase (UDP-forming)